MRISILVPIGFAVFLTSVSPLRGAELIRLQSGTAATPLLELFTSEGCNSCPPAETWLSRLTNHARLWKDFVPVAFHVDYWDYLGWKDPFADRRYSERQRGHAAQWRNRSIYTPGFFLNGKEWSDWSRHDAPASAPANINAKSVGVLTAVSENGRQWNIQFQPVIESASSKYNLHAVLLGFDLSSNVKAGENRGRVLQHDFVVLADAKVAATNDGQSFRGTLSLDTKPGHFPKRLALAAWVASVGSLPPIQATGGWLPSTSEKP